MDRPNRELLQLVATHVERGVRNHEVMKLFIGICEAEGLEDLAAELKQIETTAATSVESDWCLAALIRIAQAEQQRLGELLKEMKQ